jgi:hypothetical protein
MYQDILRTSERHRVDVLPIVCERHKSLAEANGVFAGCDAIINLEFFLGYTLRGIRNAVKKKRRTSYPLREVHFDAEDANILRTGALGQGLKDRGRGKGGRGSFDSHCIEGEERNDDCSGS